ncbi:MAG TPA: YoaK family protein [Acidimicrobiales bacterium]|nr:YoaK family protein [Acidimicrobiales bacterium]
MTDQPAGSRAAVVLDDPRHGPLPALLLVLTVLSGVVDAVSILRLGRVFVANMTGNVVFVGFALAGAPGFVLSASLSALGGFVLGAVVGGGVGRRLGRDRAVLLRSGTLLEAALLVAALVVAAAHGNTFGRATTDLLAAMSALAMGLQTSVARRLSVPDLTTTVLTMALTGIAADTGPDGAPARTRRLMAVAAMLVGAVSGALLVLHLGATAGFALAAGLALVVVAGALAAARRPATWRAG